MSQAMQNLEEAMNSQRKNWYGDLWDKVDWYGIPNRDLPEEQRESIAREIKQRRGSIPKCPL